MNLPSSSAVGESGRGPYITARLHKPCSGLVNRNQISNPSLIVHPLRTLSQVLSTTCIPREGRLRADSAAATESYAKRTYGTLACTDAAAVTRGLSGALLRSNSQVPVNCDASGEAFLTVGSKIRLGTSSLRSGVMKPGNSRRRSWRAGYAGWSEDSVSAPCREP